MSVLRSLVTGVALFAIGIGSAQALIIDNVTYTTDSDSGLDWLDVTRTAGMSQSHVLDSTLDSNLESGALFGWRYASATELVTLVTNATGIPYSGAHYSQTSHYPSYQLGMLMFQLGPTTFDQMQTRYTLGILSDVVPNRAHNYVAQLTFNINCQGCPLNTLTPYLMTQNMSASAHHIGSFLVRDTAVVPEPASLGLMGLGLIGLGFARRKKAA